MQVFERFFLRMSFFFTTFAPIFETAYGKATRNHSARRMQQSIVARLLCALLECNRGMVAGA